MSEEGAPSYHITLPPIHFGNWSNWVSAQIMGLKGSTIPLQDRSRACNSSSTTLTAPAKPPKPEVEAERTVEAKSAGDSGDEGSSLPWAMMWKPDPKDSAAFYEASLEDDKSKLMPAVGTVVV